MGDSIDENMMEVRSPRPKFGASAPGARTTPPKPSDPYRYQLGFGNYFSSEAV